MKFKTSCLILILLFNVATSYAAQTCTTTTISGADDFNGISGISDTNVMTAGKGGDIFQWDGTSWSQMTTPNNQDLDDIFMLPDGTAYAVGKKQSGQGMVLYYNGTSWSRITSGAFANEDFKGVWAYSANEVWVVGKDGSVAMYNGTSWIDVSGAAGVGGNDIEKVWGDSSYTYLLDKDGTLYIYNRAGGTWSSSGLCDAASGDDFKDLWIDASGDVLLAAKDNSVYRYDGSTCSAVATASDELEGIYGNSNGEIYAVGKNGVVMYYDGSSWQELSQGNEDLKDVWVSSGGNAYYSGKNAEVTVCQSSLSLVSAVGSCSTLTEVTVVFSTALDSTTAENPANYAIDNGISVSGASLSGTDTVILTTSTLTDLTTYTLTVNNVESSAGATITPDSTTTFSMSCSNLIAFYRMDEAFWDGTSSEVVDSSGNGLHGTSIGGVTTSEAKVCNGAILDGITLSYVEVADDPLLDIPEELTVSLWLKTNVIPGSGLKSILSKDQNYEFHINSSGQIYWWWNNSGGSTRTLTTAATVSVDTWHHIAIVYSRSGSFQRIYIDGVQDVNTQSYSEALFNDNQPLQIGGDQAFATREFDGLIDEVRIYEKAQTQAEIQADMNATRPCGTLSCGFRDNFTSIVYNNQDGTLNWNADWVETNDNNSPSGGDAYIAAGSLVMNNDTGANNASSRPVLTREANLSGASAATLSFIFRTSSGVDNADQFRVDVSGDGGGSWATLETIPGNGSPKTEIRNYSIDSYIASNTQIRLVINNGYTQTDEDVYFYYINIAPTGLCGAGTVHHYEISHDGSGLTCEGEDITIQACRDINCSLLYTGSVTLDLTVTGAATDNYPISFSGGSTTYSLRHLTPETVTLSTSSPNPAPSSPTVCNETSTPSTSCNLTFYETGFKFLAYSDTADHDDVADNATLQSVSTQISGKRSDQGWNDQVLRIEAVRTDTETGACVAALNSPLPRNTQMRIAYIDPVAPSGSPSLSVNGKAVSTTWTELVDTTDLTFTSGLSNDSYLLYQDAGQLSLEMRHDTDGDGTYEMLGVNNPTITVRPFGFTVNDTLAYIDSATACAGGCQTAGQDFQTDVTAFAMSALTEDDGTLSGSTANNGIPDVFDDDDPTDISTYTNNDALAGNSATPNFAASATLDRVFILPGGGSSGTFSSSAVTLAAGTGSSTDANWSEVGVISLTSQSNNYLSVADADITGRSSQIGRFIPADFNVTVNPAPPTLADSCIAGGFTYLGQPFAFTLNPQIDITARNAAGADTSNYNCGGFWKLPDPYTMNYTYADSAVGGTTLAPLAGSAAAVAGETTGCDASVSVTLADNFSYSRPAVSSPVQPFAASIDFAANAAQFTDTDGVCYGGGCQPFTLANIVGANMRHGRSVALNGYGPETATAANPLTMPASTEYYDSTPAWVTNANDTCTQFSYVITPNGSITVASNPASPVTVSSGLGNISLWPTADTAPPGGTVDIAYDFPAWLDDFGVEAFFGIYRGNDRIINWREIVR